MKTHYKIALQFLVVTIMFISTVCHGEDAHIKSAVQNSSLTESGTLNEQRNTATSLIAYGEYVEGRRFRRIGLVNTIIGTPLVLTGLICSLVYVSMDSWVRDETTLGVGISSLSAGVVSLAIGIPFFVAGTRKKRKYKEIIDNPILNLSFQSDKENGLNGISASTGFTF